MAFQIADAALDQALWRPSSAARTAASSRRGRRLSTSSGCPTAAAQHRLAIDLQAEDRTLRTTTVNATTPAWPRA